MIQIFDNFMDNDIKNVLENHFLSVPHYYGHFSTETSNRFYATDMDMKNPLIMCVAEKLKKIKLITENKINFLRTYINVQHNHMDVSFHGDDGDITFLLMSSKTLKEGSGQFQIKINNDNTNIKSIDFVQNRLIMFKASWEHRGMAPLEPNIPRITLAFKSEFIR